MSKHYPTITKNLSGNLASLRGNIPDVAKGFSALAAAATKDGTLDKKTKEFIALAIGVVKQCDGCIGFHAKALVELGATREEVSEILGMCMYMGGGPAFMYAADALLAYDQFKEELQK